MGDRLQKIPQKMYQVLPSAKCSQTMKVTEDCGSKRAGHDIKGKANSMKKNIRSVANDQDL